MINGQPQDKPEPSTYSSVCEEIANALEEISALETKMKSPSGDGCSSGRGIIMFFFSIFLYIFGYKLSSDIGVLLIVSSIVLLIGAYFVFRKGWEAGIAAETLSTLKSELEKRVRRLEKDEVRLYAEEQLAAARSVPKHITQIIPERLLDKPEIAVKEFGPDVLTKWLEIIEPYYRNDTHNLEQYYSAIAEKYAVDRQENPFEYLTRHNTRRARQAGEHKENPLEVRRRERGFGEPYRTIKYPKDWRWRKYYLIRIRGGLCESCGKDLPLQLHHIRPLLYSDGGGTHELDNLRLLCSNCHEQAHIALSSKPRSKRRSKGR